MTLTLSSPYAKTYVTQSLANPWPDSTSASRIYADNIDAQMSVVLDTLDSQLSLVTMDCMGKSEDTAGEVSHPGPTYPFFMGSISRQ